MESGSTLVTPFSRRGRDRIRIVLAPVISDPRFMESNRLFRHGLPVLALLLTLISGSFALADKPNIVIFLADDLGYNDLSVYRARHQALPEHPATAQTPSLDRLAEEGMLFTNFYSGASVCSPSRGALLTGRNATRIGIYNWIPPEGPMHLRPREVTIAEALSELGYRRGHFGKWHLANDSAPRSLPMRQGFEYAFYTRNNAKPSHHNPVNFMRNGEAVGPLEGYASHLVVDEAIEWLESFAEDDSAPFFLNVWFNEPHEVTAAPEELLKRHPYRPRYYGSIENMDAAIGRLLDYLDERDIAQNTLVIFASDNGSQWGGSNAPIRGSKCFNFEGGVRVPFIVRWPGEVPAGGVNDTIGSFVDVLPTLAARTGAQLPQDRVIDGIDLGPALFGGEAMEHGDPVFFFRYFHEPVGMLREGNYVLLGFEEPIPYRQIYDPFEMSKIKPEPGAGRWSAWGFSERHMEYLEQCVPTIFKLFDISVDLDQSHDIAADHPEIVERMAKSMLERREEMIEDGGNWYEESVR